MATASNIEWTEATWNPIAGCSIKSPGCHHCYAATMAHRLAAMGQAKYAGTTEKKNAKVHWTGKINLDLGSLGVPLGWRKPKRIFVNSMSDLFHEDVPDEFIRKVFAVMSVCGQHTFQVLTKRVERMRDWFADDENNLSACQAEWVGSDEYDATLTPTGRSRVRDGSAINGTYGPRVGEGNYWPLPNVWLGVSVEDQARADERIPLLLQTPAAVRFLSCEPLLGPVELSDLSGWITSDAVHWWGRPILGGSGINWVIGGGESGPGARPMHPDWARSLRDQCQAAGVAFFFKQWGEYRPGGAPVGIRMEWVHPSGLHYGTGEPIRGEGLPVETMSRVGKKAAGRLLDGRTWDEFPEVPAHA